jgi:hypothetical protein
MFFEARFVASLRIADEPDRVYTSCSILVSTEAPVYPTCTVNIDMDPPSTPSMGKVMFSPCWLVAIT